MLSFDRPDHDALHEVLLDEGVQAYDRQDRNDDHNVFDLAQRHRLVDDVVRLFGKLVTCVDQQPHQEDLYRLKLRVRQVEQCREVGVPEHDCGEEGDDGEKRFRKRYDDRREDPEFTGSVHLCRFYEAVGYRGLNVDAGDDEIPGTDGVWQNHGQTGVVQPQVPNQYEGWNQSAGEEHGDDDEKHHRTRQPKGLAGQGMLLRRFGSIAGIREASMDEIAAVPGMTLKLAQRLKEYL